MKIRNGFVSNSSSSSFLISGRFIEVKDIEPEHLQSGCWIDAGPLADGNDIFKIHDIEMLNFCKKFLRDCSCVYEDYNYGKDSLSEYRDNHSSSDIDDLYRRYYDLKKDRKRKIKKIMNVK